MTTLNHTSCDVSASHSSTRSGCVEHKTLIIILSFKSVKENSRLGFTRAIESSCCLSLEVENASEKTLRRKLFSCRRTKEFCYIKILNCALEMHVLISFHAVRLKSFDSSFETSVMKNQSIATFPSTACVDVS